MSFDPVPLKDLLGDKGYIRGPFGSALKRAELKEEGVPVYEQQHAITGSREFRFYVDEKKYEELKRFTVKNADLIISCSGTVGRISVIEDKDPKGIISQALLILRPDVNKVLPQFLYYFFTSRQGFNELINASQGAVQLNIASRAVVEKIPVPLPGLDKQREIVNILKGIDDKIELNHQINQTLEEMAQAIFKSWFVEFEPVKAKMLAKENGQNPERAAMCAISGKTDNELTQLSPVQIDQLQATAALFPDEMTTSEQGVIPKGWGLKALYETAEYINGAAFKSRDFSDVKEGLPIVKIAELKQGITAQTQFTIGVFKEKYRIDNGAVLYSWSGSPKTSLEVFKWFGGEGWLNQHIFKINFESDAHKYFTFFLLKQIKPLLIQTAMDKQTTGLGHITVADMKRILVPFPDIPILSEFARSVGPLYEEDSVLKQQIDCLSQTIDALLPKFISGQIILSDTTELQE